MIALIEEIFCTLIGTNFLHTAIKNQGEQFPKVDDFLWADKALKETVPSACFELAAQM